MVKLTASLVVIVCAVGCGEVKGGKGLDASIDSKTADAVPVDGAVDSPMIDGPAGTVALTVKNYLAWCSVSANGGATTTAGTQTVNVQPGTIPLVAKAANSTFIVAGNMWHHTTGDSGNGEPGTVTGSGANTQSAANTLVVASTAKCVWVCCPFTDGSGCNVPEQCP